ncbi:MAG: hypothetical protein WKG07_34040 [Hymenobacter sp.]
MPLSLRLPLPASCLALLIVNCALLTETKAQAPKTYTSAEILLGLKKLNVLGSVLYIAAHPDDENTAPHRLPRQRAACSKPAT